MEIGNTVVIFNKILPNCISTLTFAVKGSVDEFNLLDLIRLKKYLADDSIPLGKQESEQQAEQPLNEPATTPDNKQTV